MTKILVPVDGSAHADSALQQLLAQRGKEAGLEVHLLSVQLPVDGHARSFVSTDELNDYHRAEGMAALANARQLLTQAGLPDLHHIAVGPTAATICRFAQEKAFDEIVMGTHGRTGLLHLVMGSVASEVSKTAKVKVTLINATSA